ncbi:MAG: hypothetical protein A3K19_06360 [Lentisphaerae bacterium RIFOXYB12_FULL_65_16]|nr:MAG: hypothetical protein A3K19_06360 [Lentisphaerae bacterium RIFOXYB12_FULL_65_16]
MPTCEYARGKAPAFYNQDDTEESMFGLSSGFKFTVNVVAEEEYRRVYDGAAQAVILTGSLTKAALQKEFEMFDASLREAIAKNWEIDEFGGDEKDCAVSDEWQGGFFHCGGIYTNRICCGNYVQTILDVIGALPHSDRWTYHTAVENLNDDEPVIGLGEFLIRQGNVFAPDDGNNYKKILKRR